VNSDFVIFLHIEIFAIRLEKATSGSHKENLTQQVSKRLGAKTYFKYPCYPGFNTKARSRKLEAREIEIEREREEERESGGFHPVLLVRKRISFFFVQGSLKLKTELYFLVT
jgi:hypothetical protein